MHICRAVLTKIKSNFTVMCLAGLGFSCFLSGCATASRSLKSEVRQERYVDELGNEYIIEYVEEYENGDYSEGEIVILDEPQEGYRAPDVSEEKTVISKKSAEELPGITKDKKHFTLPAGSIEHKVWIWQETGDCLWSIAKQYYGDPWKWKKIYMANQDTISDPNIIFPKQILAIPPDR